MQESLFGPIFGAGHVVWSPDGSRIAFADSSGTFAVDADGTGPVEPIDQMTYASWNDGSYP